MEKISENEGFETKHKVTLDDFSMISVIGKGSFAKVVLVKKNNTNDLYALKVMKKKHIKKKK
jgi:serum/glucocorticoid-regulated kinase 2